MVNQTAPPVLCTQFCHVHAQKITPRALKPNEIAMLFSYVKVGHNTRAVVVDVVMQVPSLFVNALWKDVFLLMWSLYYNSYSPPSIYRAFLRLRWILHYFPINMHTSQSVLY